MRCRDCERRAEQRAGLERHPPAPFEEAGRVVQAERGAVQPHQIRRLHVLGLPPHHRRQVLCEQTVEAAAVGAQRRPQLVQPRLALVEGHRVGDRTGQPAPKLTSSPIPATSAPRRGRPGHGERTLHTRQIPGLRRGHEVMLDGLALLVRRDPKRKPMDPGSRRRSLQLASLCPRVMPSALMSPMRVMHEFHPSRIRITAGASRGARWWRRRVTAASSDTPSLDPAPRWLAAWFRLTGSLDPCRMTARLWLGGLELFRVSACDEG